MESTVSTSASTMGLSLLYFLCFILQGYYYRHKHLRTERDNYDLVKTSTLECARVCVLKVFILVSSCKNVFTLVVVSLTWQQAWASQCVNFSALPPCWGLGIFSEWFRRRPFCPGNLNKCILNDDDSKIRKSSPLLPMLLLSTATWLTYVCMCSFHM